MYKAIHHDGRKPLVDIASYLQRHDIVYRRPSLEPFLAGNELSDHVLPFQ